MPMFIAMLFTVAKTWKQPLCPSIDEWIKKESVCVCVCVCVCMHVYLSKNAALGFIDFFFESYISIFIWLKIFSDFLCDFIIDPLPSFFLQHAILA